MYRLEQETAADYWEVEALSSYRLREGVAAVAALCLTARDSLGILAGAIRYWPILVGPHPALLLGPVAVHPTRQGEGLGGLLIDDSAARAAALGWDRILLVGDAPYYARFGFHKLEGVHMPPPTNPDRVLGTGDWRNVAGPVTKWQT